MARHPEAREEGDGELEHEGGNVGREGNEAKVEDLFVKDEMIENIVQHPLQDEVQASAGRITEQLKAHELAKRRIEEVDDRGQGTFNPILYVSEGCHWAAKIGKRALQPQHLEIAKQFLGFPFLVCEAQHIAATA